MMIHCHILRHAELGMMFLAQIVAAPPLSRSDAGAIATRVTAPPLALSRAALAATRGAPRNGNGASATVAGTPGWAGVSPRTPRHKSVPAMLLAAGLFVGLATGIALSTWLRVRPTSAARASEAHPDCCYTAM